MPPSGVLLLFVASCCAALRCSHGEPLRAEPRSRGSVDEDSCKDCMKIIELFSNLMSQNDTQEKIRNSLHSLCNHLPSPKAKVSCGQQVDKYLPLVIRILVKQIKPDLVCKLLGLCKNQSEDNVAEILISHTLEPEDPVAKGMEARQVKALPLCTICVFVIDKLQRFVPRDATKAVIEKVLDYVCSMLSKPMELLCTNVIGKFTGNLLDLLLSSAAPRAVCTILQLCHGQHVTPPVEIPPTDCQSCQTVAVLSQFYLGSNATDLQTTSFLQAVCRLHPCAIPKCELFTQKFGLRLQRVLGKMESTLDMCEKVGLCPVATEARPDTGERCTGGMRYICRDVSTAKACNFVSFCEKFFWK